MKVCSRPEQEEADPLKDLIADTQELRTDLSSKQEPQLLEVAHYVCFTGKPGRMHIAVHMVDKGMHPSNKPSSYHTLLVPQKKIR